MHASSIDMRLRWAVLLCAVLCAFLLARPAAAGNANNIAAELLAESPALPGGSVDLALHFQPAQGWHGYWLNPGDAGFGMSLEWRLPDGARVESPRYPVPDTLLAAGLMNHVYKGDYAVLVRLRLPDNVAPGARLPVSVKAEWLACTDTICVPESATLATTVVVGQAGVRDSRYDARFDRWRAAIPPLLDSKARHVFDRRLLRIAIPLPAAQAVAEPHVFLADDGLIDYAGRQGFSRKNNWLIAELPLRDGAGTAPDGLQGVIRTSAGQGFAFAAAAGVVPEGGKPLALVEQAPALGWLLLGALVGGVLLNLMPCVFPILSLKALSLARAGQSETHARTEGLAYTAGAVLACLGLGALLMVLRAGGQQIGWAFQLQEPGVVVALLLLMVAITANLLGLYELPGPAITRKGQGGGAFATGVLAAFVATPCTGPFMAAALGAALLLPPAPALLLFGALGLGLALPFLVLGFVPPLRRWLPRPGAWMMRFRRWMALPMGMTALALLWLAGRLGGVGYAGIAALVAGGLLVALWVMGQRQRLGLGALAPFLMVMAPFTVFAVIALPGAFAPMRADEGGVLEARRFSETALAEARASGRPVFVWFTADWCITCKVNERVAIERAATREAFTQAGVIVLRGDWTRRDAEITRFLAAQGAAGVPLYLWYEAGGKAEQLPQMLAPTTLVRLAERDRGRRPEAAGEDRSAPQ